MSTFREVPARNPIHALAIPRAALRERRLPAGFGASYIDIEAKCGQGWRVAPNERPGQKTWRIAGPA